jgi:hypothetical protein
MIHSLSGSAVPNLIVDLVAVAVAAVVVVVGIVDTAFVGAAVMVVVGEHWWHRIVIE